MIIFCDGIFDLFHHGHVNHFKKIKTLYNDVYLIVGVLNDEESKKYKRQPIFNEKKRLKLVNSCKFVDEVILNYPSIVTEEFINNKSIDLVVHAFSDDSDFNKQLKYFEIPIKLNKFLKLDYDNSISTTQIIENINNIDNTKDINDKEIKVNDKNGWDLIWEKKGYSNDKIINLNGYDDTDFIPTISFKNIVKNLNIKKQDKVLEIGCGAGVFSNLFNEDYDYYGIDYSAALINHNIKLFNSKVYNCQANNLPYKDKFFDVCFSIGVFEYFPSKEYMQQVLKEIQRVTKNSIYILNIRKKTHLSKKTKHKFKGVFQHLIYNESDFEDFEIIKSTYESDLRFSAIKYLN